MVVGVRRAGLSISKTADQLGFSRTTISRVYREWSEKEKISSERQLCGRKCLVDVRGQRRMDRLVIDDRKTTVTQITTRYNQDLQNTISEHTTRRTLKQMGSSSRRPHRVPLLSDKNSTRRIQFTQTHQNCTTEAQQKIVKPLPGLMSLDFWCDIQMGHNLAQRTWKHGSSCLVSTVQAAGGVMVWGGYFLGTLWAPINWASFKHHSLPEYCCWPCPSLYDYSVPSSDVLPAG